MCFLTYAVDIWTFNAMNNKLCLRTQKYNFLLLYHNELLLLVSPLVQNFYKTSIFIINFEGILS